MHRVCLLPVLLSAVSILTHSEAVLNAPLTSRDSVPYHAFLYVTSPTVGFCSGSIISRSWILTAAHCVDQSDTGSNETARDFVATVSTASGFNYISWLVTAFSVETVIIHGGYNETSLENDIALLKLQDRLRWSSKVRPIRLYNGTDDDVRGTAIVSGWGDLTQSDYDEKRHPGNLRMARVPLIPPTEQVCQGANNTTTPTFSFNHQIMLCTEGMHTGPCGGDSGGPLTYQGQQIGIISYSSKGCAPPKNTVYTRVSAYIDWIDANCEDCLSLAEPRDFKEYAPAPTQRPRNEQLKYQVLITSTESTEAPPTLASEVEWSCSGSIIADSWVLTSEECLEYSSEYDFKIEKFWVLPVRELEEDDLKWIAVKETFVDKTKTVPHLTLFQVEREFEWSESVGVVELQLEPLRWAETGVIFVAEVAGDEFLDEDSVPEPWTPSRVVSVDLAGPEACAKIIALRYSLEDQPADLFLCGAVVNLDGGNFVWNAGSLVMLENGRQLGVSFQSNVSDHYTLFVSVAGYARWIQETCGGCLGNFGGRGIESTENRFGYHLLGVILLYLVQFGFVVGILLVVFVMMRKLMFGRRERAAVHLETIQA